MAGRKYDRLAIEHFGAHLLATGDLDPIYIALVKLFRHPAGSMPALKRWLVAYWCFYHAGQASYISEAEGEEFWARMRACTKNEELSPIGQRWQRGHERRHFRGEAASKAIRTMMGKYLRSPEQLVDDITDGSLPEGYSLSFKEVTERAQRLPLFGPWISFKVADMVDRVLGIPVDFTGDDVFMFKDPTEAAFRLWRLKAGLNESAMPKEPAKAISQVVSYLTDYFENHKAPPLYDRPVGLQEVETILCKWKSHQNGHYPLNNDIDEIRAGCTPWKGVSDTAQQFMAAMPDGNALFIK
jgi:hypothetical protein